MPKYAYKQAISISSIDHNGYKNADASGDDNAYARPIKRGGADTNSTKKPGLCGSKCSANMPYTIKPAAHICISRCPPVSFISKSRIGMCLKIF